MQQVGLAGVPVSRDHGGRLVLHKDGAGLRPVSDVAIVTGRTRRNDGVICIAVTMHGVPLFTALRFL